MRGGFKKGSAQKHIDSIKRNPLLRGCIPLCRRAVMAAELAMEGEPSFGLIHPPGHHASQNSCWGFCCL